MSKVNRNIFLILGILILGLFAWYFGALLGYILIAAVVALIGRPLLRLMDKVQIRGKKIPDALQAVLALLLIIGTILLIFGTFIPPLVNQLNKIQKVANSNTLAQGLGDPIKTIEMYNDQFGFIPEGQSVPDYIRNNINKILNGAKVSNILSSIVGFTGDFLIASFSILFIAFFFLKERGLMHNIVMTLTPSRFAEEVNNILEHTKDLLTRYFIGVILEVLIVGGLISIGLGLLGVENAFVIGFFAGLFNVIPYLGPLIGGVVGIVFAVLGALEMDFNSYILPLALKVLVVFAVVQMIDNFVLQPFIYSSSVKAHPLEIFLVILMAGNVAGVGGMILAIPVYTILRVIAKEFFDQFRIVQSITKDL
ncbi:MAG: AI-2E family transporter [Bacteroidota bacterium]